MQIIHSLFRQQRLQEFFVTCGLLMVAGVCAAQTSTTPSALFRIMPNGNVGIGTSNPTSRLQVIGNVNITGCIEFNGERAQIPNNPPCLPEAPAQPGNSDAAPLPGHNIDNGSTIDVTQSIQFDSAPSADGLLALLSQVGAPSASKATQQMLLQANADKLIAQAKVAQQYASALQDAAKRASDEAQQVQNAANRAVAAVASAATTGGLVKSTMPARVTTGQSLAAR